MPIADTRPTRSGMSVATLLRWLPTHAPSRRSRSSAGGIGQTRSVVLSPVDAVGVGAAAPVAEARIAQLHLPSSMLTTKEPTAAK